MSLHTENPSADRRHMQTALGYARKALAQGEFPVGCIIVCDDREIAAGARKGTADGGRNETDHAEIVALRRLQSMSPQTDDRSEMTLFSTLEPCLMCYAAIIFSGIGRIVYAYEDAMGGGTRCDFSTLPPLYADRKPQVVAGLMRSESLALFKQFFSNPDCDYWRNSYLEQYTLSQP